MTCKCHRAWGKLGKEKRRTIFWNILTAVCVVIIGLIGLAVLVEVELRPRDTSNKVLYPDQSEDRIPGDRPHAGFMALPLAPHCGHLHDHPGKHKLWAECMGVGYNNSPTDRRLYRLREDLPPDCTKVPEWGRNREWVTYCEGVGGELKVNRYPSDPRFDDPTND